VSDRCSDCGNAAPDGIDVRDAANHKHRYHVNCWARVLWWIEGNDGEPSREYVAKVRATNAKVTP